MARAVAARVEARRLAQTRAAMRCQAVARAFVTRKVLASARDAAWLTRSWEESKLFLVYAELQRVPARALVGGTSLGVDDASKAELPKGAAHVLSGDAPEAPDDVQGEASERTQRKAHVAQAEFALAAVVVARDACRARAACRAVPAALAPQSMRARTGRATGGSRRVPDVPTAAPPLALDASPFLTVGLPSVDPQVVLLAEQRAVLRRRSVEQGRAHLKLHRTSASAAKNSWATPPAPLNQSTNDSGRIMAGEGGAGAKPNVAAPLQVRALLRDHLFIEQTRAVDGSVSEILNPGAARLHFGGFLMFARDAGLFEERRGLAYLYNVFQRAWQAQLWSRRVIAASDAVEAARHRGRPTRTRDTEHMEDEASASCDATPSTSRATEFDKPPPRREERVPPWQRSLEQRGFVEALNILSDAFVRGALGLPESAERVALLPTDTQPRTPGVGPVSGEATDTSHGSGSDTDDTSDRHIRRSAAPLGGRHESGIENGADNDYDRVHDQGQDQTRGADGTREGSNGHSHTERRKRRDASVAAASRRTSALMKRRLARARHLSTVGTDSLNGTSAGAGARAGAGTGRHGRPQRPLAGQTRASAAVSHRGRSRSGPRGRESSSEPDAAEADTMQHSLDERETAQRTQRQQARHEARLANAAKRLTSAIQRLDQRSKHPNLSMAARRHMFMVHCVFPAAQRRYEQAGGSVLWDCVMGRTTAADGAKLRRRQLADRCDQHWLEGCAPSPAPVLQSVWSSLNLTGNPVLERSQFARGHDDEGSAPVTKQSLAEQAAGSAIAIPAHPDRRKQRHLPPPGSDDDVCGIIGDARLAALLVAWEHVLAAVFQEEVALREQCPAEHEIRQRGSASAALGPQKRLETFRSPNHDSVASVRSGGKSGEDGKYGSKSTRSGRSSTRRRWYERWHGYALAETVTQPAAGDPHTPLSSSVMAMGAADGSRPGVSLIVPRAASRAIHRFAPSSPTSSHLATATVFVEAANTSSKDVEVMPARLYDIAASLEVTLSARLGVILLGGFLPHDDAMLGGPLGPALVMQAGAPAGSPHGGGGVADGIRVPWSPRGVKDSPHLRRQRRLSQSATGIVESLLHARDQRDADADALFRAMTIQAEAEGQVVERTDVDRPALKEYISESASSAQYVPQWAPDGGYEADADLLLRRANPHFTRHAPTLQLRARESRRNQPLSRLDYASFLRCLLRTSLVTSALLDDPRTFGILLRCFLGAFPLVNNENSATRDALEREVVRVTAAEEYGKDGRRFAEAWGVAESRERERLIQEQLCEREQALHEAMKRGTTLLTPQGSALAVSANSATLGRGSQRSISVGQGANRRSTEMGTSARLPTGRRQNYSLRGVGRTAGRLRVAHQQAVSSRRASLVVPSDMLGQWKLFKGPLDGGEALADRLAGVGGLDQAIAAHAQLASRNVHLELRIAPLVRPRRGCAHEVHQHRSVLGIDPEHWNCRGRPDPKSGSIAAADAEQEKQFEHRRAGNDADDGDDDRSVTDTDAESAVEPHLAADKDGQHADIAAELKPGGCSGGSPAVTAPGSLASKTTISAERRAVTSRGADVVTGGVSSRTYRSGRGRWAAPEAGEPMFFSKDELAGLKARDAERKRKAREAQAAQLGSHDIAGLLVLRGRAGATPVSVAMAAPGAGLGSASVSNSPDARGSLMHGLSDETTGLPNTLPSMFGGLALKGAGKQLQRATSVGSLPSKLRAKLVAAFHRNAVHIEVKGSRYRAMRAAEAKREEAANLRMLRAKVGAPLTAHQQQEALSGIEKRAAMAQRFDSSTLAPEIAALQADSDGNSAGPGALGSSAKAQPPVQDCETRTEQDDQDPLLADLWGAEAKANEPVFVGLHRTVPLPVLPVRRILAIAQSERIRVNATELLVVLEDCGIGSGGEKRRRGRRFSLLARRKPASSPEQSRGPAPSTGDGATALMIRANRGRRREPAEAEEQHRSRLRSLAHIDRIRRRGWTHFDEHICVTVPMYLLVFSRLRRMRFFLDHAALSEPQFVVAVATASTHGVVDLGRFKERQAVVAKLRSAGARVRAMVTNAQLLDQLAQPLAPPADTDAPYVASMFGTMVRRAYCCMVVLSNPNTQWAARAGLLSPAGCPALLPLSAAKWFVQVTKLAPCVSAESVNAIMWAHAQPRVTLPGETEWPVPAKAWHAVRKLVGDTEVRPSIAEAASSMQSLQVDVNHVTAAEILQAMQAAGGAQFEERLALTAQGLAAALVQCMREAFVAHGGNKLEFIHPRGELPRALRPDPLTMPYPPPYRSLCRLLLNREPKYILSASQRKRIADPTAGERPIESSSLRGNNAKQQLSKAGNGGLAPQRKRVLEARRRSMEGILLAQQARNGRKRRGRGQGGEHSGSADSNDDEGGTGSMGVHARFEAELVEGYGSEGSSEEDSNEGTPPPVKRREFFALGWRDSQRAAGNFGDEGNEADGNDDGEVDEVGSALVAGKAADERESQRTRKGRSKGGVAMRASVVDATAAAVAAEAEASKLEVQETEQERGVWRMRREWRRRFLANQRPSSPSLARVADAVAKLSDPGSMWMAGCLQQVSSTAEKEDAAITCVGDESNAWKGKQSWLGMPDGFNLRPGEQTTRISPSATQAAVAKRAAAAEFSANADAEAEPARADARARGRVRRAAGASLKETTPCKDSDDAPCAEPALVKVAKRRSPQNGLEAALAAVVAARVEAAARAESNSELGLVLTRDKIQGVSHASASNAAGITDKEAEDEEEELVGANIDGMPQVHAIAALSQPLYLLFQAAQRDVAGVALTLPRLPKSAMMVARRKSVADSVQRQFTATQMDAAPFIELQSHVSRSEQDKVHRHSQAMPHRPVAPATDSPAMAAPRGHSAAKAGFAPARGATLRPASRWPAGSASTGAPIRPAVASARSVGVPDCSVPARGLLLLRSPVVELSSPAHNDSTSAETALPSTSGGSTVSALHAVLAGARKAKQEADRDEAEKTRKRDEEEAGKQEKEGLASRIAWVGEGVSPCDAMLRTSVLRLWQLLLLYTPRAFREAERLAQRRQKRVILARAALLQAEAIRRGERCTDREALELAKAAWQEQEVATSQAIVQWYARAHRRFQAGPRLQRGKIGPGARRAGMAASGAASLLTSGGRARAAKPAVLKRDSGNAIPRSAGAAAACGLSHHESGRESVQASGVIGGAPSARPRPPPRPRPKGRPRAPTMRTSLVRHRHDRHGARYSFAGGRRELMTADASNLMFDPCALEANFGDNVNGSEQEDTGGLGNDGAERGVHAPGTRDVERTRAGMKRVTRRMSWQSDESMDADDLVSGLTLTRRAGRFGKGAPASLAHVKEAAAAAAAAAHNQTAEAIRAPAVAYRFAAAANDAERRQLLTAGTDTRVYDASIQARRQALDALGPAPPPQMVERPQPTPAQVAQLHSEAIRSIAEGKQLEGAGGAELLPWLFGGADSCRPGAGVTHTRGTGLTGQHAALSKRFGAEAARLGAQRFERPFVPRIALGQVARHGDDTAAWQKQLVDRSDLAQTCRPAVEASQSGRDNGDSLSLHQFRMALTWREELRRREGTQGRLLAARQRSSGTATGVASGQHAVATTARGAPQREREPQTGRLAHTARKSPDCSEEAKQAAKVGLASVMQTLFEPPKVPEPVQNSNRVQGVVTTKPAIGSGLGGKAANASAPADREGHEAQYAPPQCVLPQSIQNIDLVGELSTGGEVMSRVPNALEYEAVLTAKIPGNRLLQEYFVEWHSAKARWDGRERALTAARAERVELEHRRLRRNELCPLAVASPEVFDIRDAVKAEAEGLRGRPPEAKAGGIAWVELTAGSAPHSRTAGELQRLLRLQHERALADEERPTATELDTDSAATGKTSDSARGGIRDECGGSASTPTNTCQPSSHQGGAQTTGGIQARQLMCSKHSVLLQPFPVPANPTTEELNQLMSPLNRDRLVAELAVREHAGVALAGGALARAFRGHPGMLRRVDTVQIAVRAATNSKTHRRTNAKSDETTALATERTIPQQLPQVPNIWAPSPPTPTNGGNIDIRAVQWRSMSHDAAATAPRVGEDAGAAASQPLPGAGETESSNARRAVGPVSPPERGPRGQALGKSATEVPRHQMRSLRQTLSLTERLQRAKADLYDAVGSVNDVLGLALHATTAITEGRWIRVAGMHPLPEELSAAETALKQRVLAEKMGGVAPPPSVFHGQDLPPGLSVDQLSKATPLGTHSGGRAVRGMDNGVDEIDAAE